MRRPKDMGYEYTPGQYDDIDLEAQDIVEARYTRVPGYEGNADIEALPKPPEGRDAMHRGTVVPKALMSDDADVGMRIWALRSLRIPLINQKQINDRIYHGMVNSYANRTYSQTRHAVPIEIDGENVTIDILSDSYEHSITTGSAVIGEPGTGKSTAARCSQRLYPKAILHRFEGGHYIQIPIIRVTAYSDSNISSLFSSFAGTIDRILDTGDAHRKMLPSSNIGQMCEIVIKWIQRYHIGCWIIEEIGFFAFSPASSRSFENVVTIMEQTGIFVFATGNNDFYDKIKGNLRQERRFLANFIDMNEVSRDKGYMKSFICKVWTRYLLPELRGLYSDDICEAVYRWTLGSVDMITILLVAVQRDYLERKKKAPGMTPGEIVTRAFVEETAEKNLSRMLALFSSSKADAFLEYDKIREDFDQMSENDIRADLEGKAAMRAAIEEDIISGYDSAEMLYKITESIMLYTDDFTKKQIENALYYCEKNTDGFKKLGYREMLRTVKARLESSAAKRKSEKKKKEQENIGAMFESLKVNMDDPDIQTPA